MEDMIERVARAIFAESERICRVGNERSMPRWDGLKDEERNFAMALARAAIAAMREPTMEMLAAAERLDGTHACDRAPPDHHWDAMIDAVFAHSQRSQGTLGNAGTPGTGSGMDGNEIVEKSKSAN